MLHVAGAGLLLCISLIVLAACGEEDGSRFQVIETYDALDEAEGDRKVLDQMRKMGSDLAKPTDVRWYVYVPTKSDAETLATNARGQGWRVDLDESATGDNWLCLCSRDAAPNPETIAAMRSELAACAETPDVDIDGWEAAITK